MGESQIPNFLAHYYDAVTGPFVNLSDLPAEEAEIILERIRREGQIFASRRALDYLAIRRELEGRVRHLFELKGGQPVRQRPHYIVLGACAWLRQWYVEGCEVSVPLAAFDPAIVSFTYGDTFPAMRYADGKPYRQQVYTVKELPELVGLYGLPQEWNADGKAGPDRYIEAQVWDDASLRGFLCRFKP
jgi:hypothetical protein